MVVLNLGSGSGLSEELLYYSS